MSPNNNRTSQMQDWWPITRDCTLYTISVVVLACFAYDGVISLIESTVMVSLVPVYFIILVLNKRLKHCMKWLMEINLSCCRPKSYGNKMISKDLTKFFVQTIALDVFFTCIFQTFQHLMSKVI